jgi:hypothetical protein
VGMFEIGKGRLKSRSLFLSSYISQIDRSI